MTQPRDEVPFWPRVVAVVRPDGTGEVTINGTSHPVHASDVPAARAAVLALVSEQTATTLGRPVRIDSSDPTGNWQLIVHPNGHVEDADAPEHTRRGPRNGRRTEEPLGPVTPPATISSPTPPAPAQAPPPPTPLADLPLFRSSTPPAASSPPAAPTPAPAPPLPAGPAAAPADASPPAPAPAAPRSLPTLEDLLDTRPAAPAGPAQLGWQGTVHRLTGGLISPAPSPAEVRHRHAVTAVQRSLDGPKTIVVCNPKGGAHKTTATLLIAATFGVHRGGYTLAWDNNETRGTLGWRANPARHSNTAVDLLRDLDRFTDVRAARVGDLDNYVRTQGSAQFDVLASDEDAASAASIDAEAFHQLHRTLARFYRVMVVDTGNNMRASNWQAAVDAADQLVIVSTVREDTAQSAAWLIDALRAAGNEQAVAQAVTVLTAPARTPDTALRRRLHHHFGQLTRAVLDVPHDRALVAGGPIPYDALTPASREAWLQAAAAIADGL